MNTDTTTHRIDDAVIKFHGGRSEMDTRLAGCGVSASFARELEQELADARSTIEVLETIREHLTAELAETKQRIGKLDGALDIILSECEANSHGATDHPSTVRLAQDISNIIGEQDETTP